MFQRLFFFSGFDHLISVILPRVFQNRVRIMSKYRFIFFSRGAINFVFFCFLNQSVVNILITQTLNCPDFDVRSYKILSMIQKNILSRSEFFRILEVGQKFGFNVHEQSWKALNQLQNDACVRYINLNRAFWIINFKKLVRFRVIL